MNVNLYGVLDLLSNEKSTYLGLVDLIFAYSYNHRMFEGENSVESVWCIGKVSPTLSCLEVKHPAYTASVTR